MADAIGPDVPADFAPGGEIVEREDAGAGSPVGHRKIGSVKDVEAFAAEGEGEPGEPPFWGEAAGGGVVQWSGQSGRRATSWSLRK